MSRSHAFLLRFSDTIRALNDPAQIQAEACRLLGQHLQVDRAYYGEIDADHVIAGPGHVAEVSPLPSGRFPLSSFGQALIDRYRRGEVVAIDDVASDPAFTPGERENLSRIQVAAFASVTLTTDGKWVAGLSIHSAVPRRWTEAELQLLHDAADRMWSAVERAKREQALRTSEARQAFLVRLGDALRALADPLEVQAEAARILGEGLALDHACYCEYDEGLGMATVRRAYARGDAPILVGTYEMSPVGSMVRELRAGRICASTDQTKSPLLTEAERAHYATTPVRGAVTVPLVKRGKLVGSFSAIQSVPRTFTAEEIALVEATAERTWAALERARAEERLRGSEERYRSLFNSIQQGFVLGELVRGAGGAITGLRLSEVNPAFERLSGLRRDDQGPDGVRERIAGSQQVWITQIAAVVGDGRPVRFEHHFAAIDRWIEADVWAAGGDRFGALVTDTTARKQAEVEQRRAHEAEVRLREAANAANRAKDEFLALLGHELRNPLTPILATIELMRTTGKRAFAEERQVIERQARHLARLVDDLLDVTRIARGKVTLVRQLVEIGPLVNRALETVSPLLEEKRHRLITRLEPGLRVNGDPDRLVQVFSNLLSNAAKYTRRRGRIEVQAARTEGEVVVRVRDNGNGLTRDLLPEVFDLFRQGPQTSERAQGGLGLGLAIVRNLVLLHGGSVAAASGGPGKGSEFTLRLPSAVLVTEAHPIVRPTPPRPAPARGGRRVLIVEDNTDIADALAQLLRSKGHTVEVAHCATDALRIVRTFRAEVALLDIGLPEMDGYELARRLRAAPAHRRRMQLIAVTGYGQMGDRARALEAGFDHHLVKPFDFARLEALVRGQPKRGKESRPAPGR
jgi:signal transduction histidine kinase/ActR/RegA family two-component response regulator